MRPLKVADNIIPVSEFKAKAAEWLRRLAENGEAMVITQNGKAAGVILSPAVFDQLTERARFMQAIEEGIQDVDAGRIHTHEEVVAEMRSRFGEDDSE